VAAPALHYADAVHLRQADVEHHRVIGLGVAEKMPFLAVEGLVDDIAGVRQSLRDLAVEFLVILDDEYSHGRILLSGARSEMGENRMHGKRRPVSIRGNREFLATRAPAILARNEHHDHAHSLSALVRLAHIGQLPAVLSGDLLPYAVAVRRRGRPGAEQPGRKKAERGKAGYGAERLHDTLSSPSPLNGE